MLNLLQLYMYTSNMQIKEKNTRKKRVKLLKILHIHDDKVAQRGALVARNWHSD